MAMLLEKGNINVDKAWNNYGFTGVEGMEWIGRYRKEVRWDEDDGDGFVSRTQACKLPSKTRGKIF